jgi:amino acid transporter
VLVIFGVICTLTTKKLHQIILWFAPINILATIGICIALLICTPDKRSASFVFTHFTDDSGWGSKGWSFLLGFLNVAWCMTDYDATTHLSEETHDAAIRGPYAIVNAIFVTGVLGFLLNVTFGFCLTENYMEDIVKSPTGFPVAQIFLNAGGHSGGTAMLFLVILVQFFTGASALLANSRMTYAFARDEALPFSSFFSRIWRVTGTPVNAVWFVVIFCACLNLIGLGSTQTIIAAHLWYAKRINFIPGPFDLDTLLKPLKVSKVLNVVAIVWVVFISVVLFCPTSKPVTAENMNYAIVIAGFVAVFSMIWYRFTSYTGPRTQDVMGSAPGERGSASSVGDEEARDYATFA